MKDLIGQKYGHLKVIAFSEIKKINSRNYRYWKCKCVCNNIIDRDENILKKSTINSSCGCKKFKELSDNDLTNKTFGRLTVKSFAGYKFYGKNNIKRAYYNVQCSCNSPEFSILGTHLTRSKNGSTSCGCLRLENLKQKLNNIKKETSDKKANLVRLFSIYKSRAIKRNYEFNLTIEDFEKITSSNCFYCGQVPILEIAFRDRNTPYVYNGIDRTNNFKGYDINNVKPCCKTCNYAKKDLTEEQFYNYIKRLTDFNKFTSN